MILESYGLICDGAGCMVVLTFPAPDLNIVDAIGWILGPLGDYCPNCSLHRTNRPRKPKMIKYKQLHGGLLLAYFRELTEQGLKPSQIMTRILEKQTGPTGKPSPVEANWVKAITAALAAEMGEDAEEPEAEAEDDIPFGADDDDAPSPELVSARANALKAASPPLRPTTGVRGAR